MIENLLQLKNKILIFNDDVIKFLIIHIYLNTSLKFINKNYQKVDKEYAEMYEFFLKVLIQLFFKYFEFISDYKIQKIVF